MAKKRQTPVVVEKGDRGPKVKKLQEETAQWLDKNRLGWLAPSEPYDGICGPRTIEAAWWTAFGKGLSNEQLNRVKRGFIREHAFDLIVGNVKRTEAQQKTADRRRDDLKEARAQHKRPSLKNVSIESTAAGDPHYGGGADIMYDFVDPFLHGQYGYYIASRKRTPEQNAAVGGSSSSDHLTTNNTAFATDYGTFNGEAAAREIAKRMGYDGWSPNSYTSFNIEVDGHSYRVQILWGAGIGHDDHIHVGIRLN